jgi:hypothetical protein
MYLVYIFNHQNINNTEFLEEMSLFDKFKCLAFCIQKHPQALTSKSTTHEATGNRATSCQSDSGEFYTNKIG